MADSAGSGLTPSWLRLQKPKTVRREPDGPEHYREGPRFFDRPGFRPAPALSKARAGSFDGGNRWRADSDRCGGRRNALSSGVYVMAWGGLGGRSAGSRGSAQPSAQKRAARLLPTSYSKPGSKRSRRRPSMHFSRGGRSIRIRIEAAGGRRHGFVQLRCRKSRRLRFFPVSNG
jgi:hypothetical protein